MRNDIIKNFKAKLVGFIYLCDEANITPNEKEIDEYLSPALKKYREVFIKFCFHYWERRHEKYIINKAIAELQLHNAIS
ncbi:MAG: hypothetical protein Tsb0033_17220 [Winogradskyella sp.]